MENKQLKNIVEFMTSFGQEVKENVELPNLKTIRLRHKLALEELKETLDGIDDYIKSLEKYEYSEVKDDNILIEGYKEILDGIIDQIVILSGTMNSYGLTLGDKNSSNKFNEILDTYLNEEKFRFPMDDTMLRYNNTNIHQINIHDKVTSLMELSVFNFLTDEEISIIDIKNILYSILIGIMELANNCGFSDRKLFELIWDEIHGSNMSKLGKDGKPIYREDGKIQKGENYRKPNIVKILKEYMA